MPKVGGTARLQPADDNAFVLHNFNGLSNSDVFKIFGQDEPVTPPDQGLCVGRDATLPGDPKAVFEPVNVEIRETTPEGALLRPDVGGPTFYQDPFSDGDVRCLYDPSTQTFFFTQIGFPLATGPEFPDLNNDTDDLVVMNSHGIAAYQFDASQGGNCLADQPKVGFDNNALVISTDQFCEPNDSNFEGHPRSTTRAGATTRSPSPTPTTAASGWPPSTSRRPPSRPRSTTGALTCSRSSATRPDEQKNGTAPVRSAGRRP